MNVKNVTSAGWQVTMCDPMWLVVSECVDMYSA